MTILPDYMIHEWAENGGVSPFDPARINPASIDLCWSGQWKVAGRTGWSETIKTLEPLMIGQHEFFLLDTLETVTIPTNLCGLLMLKSSLGRQGLEHCHAGFFDCGFSGTATLEITNLAPWLLIIKKGQPIVQLVLMEMKASPERDYRATGRYGGQTGPTEAREK